MKNEEMVKLLNTFGLQITIEKNPKFIKLMAAICDTGYKDALNDVLKLMEVIDAVENKKQGLPAATE